MQIIYNLNSFECIGTSVGSSGTHKLSIRDSIQFIVFKLCVSHFSGICNNVELKLVSVSFSFFSRWLKLLVYKNKTSISQQFATIYLYFDLQC